MKKIILLGIIFMVLIMGCNSSENPTNKNVEPTSEITDMAGRTVSIPEEVENIVGVGPGALRLLVYIENQNKISGVEEVERDIKRPYIMANKELAELPMIGPPHGAMPN
ncbi:MAG: hypothetical protein ACOCZ6_05340 [Nanoarchaeota archaeon]